jgi:ATP-dependent DNA helicase RecG
MADLNTDVRYIKGIGEKKAQALNKLGVFSLYDLISFFPRRYEDRSQFHPIAATMDGETVCIQALIADTPRLAHIRRGMDLVKLQAVDDSGSVDITFFNQPYVKDNLHRGECYNFYGRIEIKGGRRTMTNPVYEPESRAGQVTGRIMPVYRLTAGLNQKLISQAVRQGLDSCLDQFRTFCRSPCASAVSLPK